mmetsp:Transcript_11927/g.36356  ORF Transcript_11927/g.36356 Transcript_11927/m.36356 type:complete len:178 (+) Transcript_11927:367-900(+)
MSAGDGRSRSFWDVVGGKGGGSEDRTSDGDGGESAGSTARHGTEVYPGASGSTHAEGQQETTSERLSPQLQPRVRTKARSLDGKKPTCGICGSKFTRSYDVKRHVNQVHGRRKGYPCDLCDLVFSKRLDLNEHIQREHGSVEVFNCPYCRKAFGDMERYRAHVAQNHFTEENPPPQQ